MSTVFQAQDMDGDGFWVDFDGAEGIGFWVGDPEGQQQRLSHEVSTDLVRWFHENWEAAHDTV